MILVDTSVWSAAFRRSDQMAFLPIRHELLRLIQSKEAALLGLVRQEVLSGMAHANQFSHLRDLLRAFLDFPVETEDFERAAECFNQCRAKGIQGSHTDFLLCALAQRHDISIFTTDNDFQHYKKLIPIRLHPVPLPSA